MNKRQQIFLAVWLVVYIATMYYFKFKFGVSKISIAFAVTGVALMFLLGRTKKSN